MYVYFCAYRSKTELKINQHLKHIYLNPTIYDMNVFKTRMFVRIHTASVLKFSLLYQGYAVFSSYFSMKT